MKKPAMAAVFAIASQAFAEPMPYQPALAFLSTREIFGLDRRDMDVYHPQQSICGVASSCPKACGSSFARCESTDNQMHCFDTGVGEVCCPDGTGNSCKATHYCSADSAGKTVCCPEGLGLDACAAKYSVPGGLHLESKTPTLTSSSPPSTSGAATTSLSAPTSSPVSSTSTAVASSSAPPNSVLSSAPASTTRSVLFDTGNSTRTAAAAGTDTRATATAVPSSVTPKTGVTTSNCAGGPDPAGFLVLLGAVTFAAFL